jgi:hypothetical protein
MSSYVWSLQRLIVIFLGVAMTMASGWTGSDGPAAAQDGQNRERASVTFTALNDSGLSGTAELSARRQGTEVSMQINGVVGVHPTHIHTGTCDDLDPNPKYPLNNVELNTTDLVGLSDSVVDVPLDELLSTPHLILIHKSAEELNTYYACGNIVADMTADVAEDTGTGGATTNEASTPTAGDEAGAGSAGDSESHAMGNMGSGPASGASGALGLAGGVGLVAVAFALMAVTLRRRELRG